MNIQKVAPLYGRFMVPVYFQKGLLLEADCLSEFHQLQLVVFILLTDLTGLPGKLEDGNINKE